MVKATQHCAADHRSEGSWASRQRALQAEAAVRTIAVVVRDELSENGAKVLLVENDDMVERLRTQGPNQSFGDCVRPGRPDRSHDAGDAEVGEPGAEVRP